MNQHQDDDTQHLDHTKPLNADTHPVPSVQPTRPMQPTSTQPAMRESQRVQRVSQQMPTVPPRYQRQQRRSRSAKDSGMYLPWWSLLIMLLGVALTSFLIVVVVISLGAPPAVESAPIIRIITAEPTPRQAQLPPTIDPARQTVLDGNASGNLSLAGPTLEAIVFTPTPMSIRVGATVSVTGVDSNQLNIRDQAGVNGTNILYRADEGTIFRVVNGPQQADGLTWWQIQDPQNPGLTGWATAQYLLVIADSNP